MSPKADVYAATTAAKQPTNTPGIYKRRNRDGSTSYVAYSRGKNKSFATMDKARRWKNAREVAGDRGELDVSNATLHEYVKGWIVAQQKAARPAVRVNTLREYERLLTNYALRYFSARTKLADVRAADVQSFVDWMANPEEQGGKVLSQRTRKNAVTPLSKIYASARLRRHVNQNPCQGVEIEDGHESGPIDPTSGQPRAFSRAQLSYVLTHAPEKYRLFFTALAYTGMRVSEAVALRWKHVYATGDEPKIWVGAGHRRGIEDSPKTARGARFIAIPAVLAEALEAQRGEDDTYVFASRNGTPLDADNTRRRVLKPLVTAAGAEWAGFHSFRHTYVSIMAEQGVKLAKLSQVLGHASPTITRDRYLHVLEGEETPAFDPRVLPEAKPALPPAEPVEEVVTGLSRAA